MTCACVDFFAKVCTSYDHMFKQISRKFFLPFPSMTNKTYNLCVKCYNCQIWQFVSIILAYLFEEAGQREFLQQKKFKKKKKNGVIPYDTIYLLYFIIYQYINVIRQKEFERKKTNLTLII